MPALVSQWRRLTVRNWRSSVACWMRSAIRCTQLRAGRLLPHVRARRVHLSDYETGPMTLPGKSNPPSWIEQLRTTVLWPDRPWAAPESASVLAATREVQRWLADRRPYNWQHRPGWRSAIADFERGADDLGPDLRSVLGSDLMDAVNAATALETALAPAQGAAGVTALLQAQKASYQAVFAQLASRWGEPGSREAAWRDLMDACRDTTVSYGTLALRRDLFWQLVHAGGCDPSQTSDLLAGVLADNARYIAVAQVRLGDVNEADVTWPSPFQMAGLSENQQLALCRRIVIQTPTPGRHVVWIAFDGAAPGVMHRAIGPISFWNSRWVRAVLEQGQAGPNLDAVPSELKATDSFFAPNVLPDDSDVVLARVELGTDVWSDPVGAAIEQAEALVALASFHVGDTKWRLIPGHVVAIDDRVTNIGTFHPVVDKRDLSSALYQSSMEAELAALAPELQGHLLITDPDLSEVVQAVRWWQQAREQPPLAAVLLHVRVVELLSQRVMRGAWQEYLDQYYRASWTRFFMLDRFAEVLRDCLLNDQQVPNPQDQAYLRQLDRDVRTNRAGGFALDLRQGFTALPKLLAIFPPDDNLGRRVRDLAGRLTLAALPGWGDDLLKDWTLARARLARIRNALAHGGPVSDESAETVRAFVEYLSGQALAIALEGLLDGRGIARANQDHRQQADRWDQDLSTAASVMDALIGV
jgi:hypothetical protein